MTILPDYSFFIQLVNFIIILLALNFILYRPIRSIIQKRADLMAQQLSDIERFNASADSKMAEYESALNETRKKGVEIRGQYKEDGLTEESKIVGAASDEAAGTLQSARDDISSKKTSAMDELKTKVDQYAQEATEKILGRS